MKESISQLIYLWNENLSDHYILHLEHTHYQKDSKDKLLIDHYIFGNVDWRCYDNTKWNKQHTFHISAKLSDVERLLNTEPFFTPENKNSKGFEKHSLDMIFLSNDLIYAFHFAVNNGNPRITMDLSSAIFGKGTHYRYVIASFYEGYWYLSSSFKRPNIYNGFRGSLLQCAQYIFEKENEMEHPYQYMINNYPDVYRKATNTEKRFI